MKVSVCKLAIKVVLLVGVVVALPATASAGDRRSKLDKVLQDALANPPDVVRVIVQTRPGMQQGLELKLRGHGDTIQAEHPSLNAFTAKVHGADLSALAADPDVLHLSIDAWVTSFGGRTTRPTNNGAPDVLRVTLGIVDTPLKGNGVNVAILDSGIDPDRDLVFNVKGFWDFTQGGLQLVRPFDDYGHGSHVAGLIASRGALSSGQFMGVAPYAGLYGFKVLDKYGRGRTSDVIAAIEYILAHRELGIHVINLSLGHPIFEPAVSDPLVQAVQRAVAQGIVVVAAAGNVGVNDHGAVGYAGITSPGNAPSAITVGAVDTEGTAIHSDDHVAPFSSRGPTWLDGFAKPDIVAPGVALTSDSPVASTLYANFPQIRTKAANGETTFVTLSGTSMAAAVATGVIALALEANAGHARPLTPNALKAVLQYSALPVKNDQGVPFDVLSQGTGEINAPGAIAMAAAVDLPLGVDGSAPLPLQTNFGGEIVPWSQALVWDENIVWGTNVVWSNSVVWDENIVWGTGENSVWGTSVCDPAVDAACENIVWGTYFACDPGIDPGCENIVWGTNIVWASNLASGSRVLGLMDGENIVWGTSDGLTEENIVWGTLDGENVVWGTSSHGVFTWGTSTSAGENVVWGTTNACDLSSDPGCQNVVWSTAAHASGSGGENIVWGTRRR